MDMRKAFLELVGGADDKIVAFLDAEGGITMAQWRVPGIPDREVIGSRLLDHVPLERRVEVSKTLERLQGMNQDQEESVDLPLLDGDGLLTWWSSTIKVYYRAGKNRVLLLVGSEGIPPVVPEGEGPFVIQGAREVTEHLITAMLNREVVEVTLDCAAQTFSCLVLPFPPPGWQAPGKRDGDGAFTPGGYLLSRRSLFVCPLEPGTGNIYLRRARQITIRFYYNVTALESEVSLRKIWTLADGHAIEFSFPPELKPEQVRSSRRVKIPPGVAIKLRIQSGERGFLEGRVEDLSLYGLSFLYISGAERPVEGDEVTLAFRAGEGDWITMEGVICQHRGVRDGGDTGRSQSYFGVSFLSAKEPADDERLRELVSQLRKKNQQNMAVKLHKYEPEPEGKAAKS